MGEAVPEVKPNLPVVRMLNDRFHVAGMPGSDFTVFTIQFHRVVLISEISFERKKRGAMDELTKAPSCQAPESYFEIALIVAIKTLRVKLG